MNFRKLFLIAGMVFVIALFCGIGVSAESGTCGSDGDNLTWEINSDDVLIISGEGAMADYSSNNSKNPPWRYRTYHDVVIQEGVTTIGENAFYESNNTFDLTIPKSLESIGENAFFSCSNLINVYAPSIEDWCRINFEDGDANPLSSAMYLYFDNVKLEDTLTIPNTIKNISAYAFYSSSGGMCAVYVPESVVSIGTDAFAYCEIERVYADSLEHWLSIRFANSGANPMSGTGSSSYLYVDNELVEHLRIPEGITSIGAYAFYGCDSIMSIDGANNLVSINDGAFGYCSYLDSIVGAGCLEKIGAYAFTYCENLSDISFLMYTRLEELGSGAFDGCKKIYSIYIPDTLINVSSACFYGCNINSLYLRTVDFIFREDGYFYQKLASGLYDLSYIYVNNELLTDLLVPNGLKSFAYNFYGCPCITSITIPNSFTYLSSSFFSKCTNLSNIYYYGTESEWQALTQNTDLTGLPSPVFLSTDSSINVTKSDIDGEQAVFDLHINSSSFGELIVAIYGEDNSLVGLNSVDSEKLNIIHSFAVNFDGTPYKYKIMFWNTLESKVPITDAYEEEF